MQRRILSLFLILILSLLIVVGCQTNSSTSNTSNKIIKPQENPQVITILMTPNISQWMKNDFFVGYKKQFEEKYGVKVNYEIYSSSDSKKSGELMTKLIVKNGPELIIDDTGIAQNLIEQGAVINLKNKVGNLSNVYDSMVGNEVYYVPIGIDNQPIILKKDALESIGVSNPNINWTVDDYYNIYDKWLNKSSRLFTDFEFNELAERYFSGLEFLDYKNKKVNINNNEFRNALDEIRRDIFSGKYLLNKNYNYENYYNLFFEAFSDEYKNNNIVRTSSEYKDQSLRSRGDESITNVLYLREVKSRIASNLVVLPNCKSDKLIFWSFGIMLNKNGANQELASEFINGLLSDEMQLQMYEYDRSKIYPVNKNIENKITEIEQNEGYDIDMIQLKNFIINKIKTGEFSLFELRDYKSQNDYSIIMKDLVKLIFNDSGYTDTELLSELQRLQEKYTIWISE